MAATQGTKKTRLDKAQVVDAACRLADRDGFEALTLASLSVELRRHASSLYNHVDGLDGLRRDVTIRSLEALSEQLRRAVLGRGSAAGLRAIADAYVDFARERPGHFEAVITWRRRSENHDKEITRAFLPGVEAIHAVMRSFGLEHPEIDFATRGFIASVVGFVQVSNGAFYGPPSEEEGFDHLVELFQVALTSGSWLGNEPVA